MAGEIASNFSTCMAFFFSLLLLSQFTMAMLENSFSSSNSTSKEGIIKKRITKEADSRERSSQNSKKDMDMALGEDVKGIDVEKRGGSRSPNPPLQWQNRIFNASEHEVPSGPNPISNR